MAVAVAVITGAVTSGAAIAAVASGAPVIKGVAVTSLEHALRLGRAYERELAEAKEHIIVQTVCQSVPLMSAGRPLCDQHVEADVERTAAEKHLVRNAALQQRCRRRRKR
eukprot:2311853-Prymnesium_polylepis.2